MPQSIGASWVEKKNRTSSTTPWVWLLEVQIDATERLRIAAYDTNLTYEGETWYAYPVSLAIREASSENKIPGLDVAVSNVGRLPMLYLSAGKIVGNRARVILLNADHLGASDDKAEDIYEVLGASVNEQVASFRLGLENPLGMQFPGEHYFRTRCRWLHEYGSPTGRCRFDSSLPGALPSCDGTLLSANGCRAHGDDEVARGLPRLHPRLFGGCPGIGKGVIA